MGGLPFGRPPISISNAYRGKKIYAPGIKIIIFLLQLSIVFAKTKLGMEKGGGYYEEFGKDFVGNWYTSSYLCHFLQILRSTLRCDETL